MKAYDSVDWKFLLHCLHCFGLPARFLNWIKVCITSPRFSICLNGTMVGYFEGKRGLRQGDRLSPYLFVITVEVFPRIMADHTIGSSGFKFHLKCASLKLTYLCFADDLLIFYKASLISIKIIKGPFGIVISISANLKIVFFEIVTFKNRKDDFSKTC
jgi:hypothetical protein